MLAGDGISTAEVVATKVTLLDLSFELITSI